MWQSTEIIKKYVTITNFSFDDNLIRDLLEGVNLGENRKYLWEDKSNMEFGPDILSTYRYILELTKGYSNEKSAYYKNFELKDIIIELLDWLEENVYSAGRKELGNWWQWEIGIPKDLNKIIAHMYEELSPKKIEKYMEGSRYFQPYAVWSGYSETAKYSSCPRKRISTGGNRVDTALIVFMRGILTENESEIKEALGSLGEVGKYVKEGDGFYIDGSFIQHGNIPYSGAYGEVLLRGIGVIQYLIGGTSLEIKDKDFNNIYESIMNGYDYLLIDGRITDSVSGRSVARTDKKGVISRNDLERGMDILTAIALISEGSPKEYKSKLEEMIKRNFIESGLNIQKDLGKYSPVEKEIVERILNDEKIEVKEFVENKIFWGMDRFVSRNKNYSFVISMHSSRVGNYESILGENIKGWHCSDGMTYLYTKDIKENFEYWATVDYYHLAGTTESTNFREDRSGLRGEFGEMSSKSFVGGAVLDESAVVGMDFISGNDKTEAKKSWYIFGDKIVCLGAGIISSDDEIHTTIENRHIVEESQIIEETDKKVILKNNIENLYTGYFILDNQEMISKYDRRVGTWSRIGEGNSDEEIHKNFFTGYINHGINPKNAKYTYMILPERKKDDLEIRDIDLEILINEKELQGVRIENISSFNFWESGKYKGLEVFNPVSLILKEEKEKIEISISNPTQKEEKIKFSIEGKFEIENCKENMRLKFENGKTIVEIFTEKSGESFKLILLKKF